MEFTLEEYKKAIAQKGYMQIPFAGSPELILEAIERFFTFLELPVERKLPFGWLYQLTADERGCESGYRLRTATDGKHDNKEYFHYNPDVHRLILERPDAPPELLTFLEAAEKIYAEAAKTMEPVIEALSIFPPRIDLTSPAGALRFLKYDQAEPGEFLARGHYDRNLSSLAIAESAPGLRIGQNPEQLEEVHHEPGKAILFPSLILEEQSHGEIKASWHDVVQKSEDGYRPGVARWAIVLFPVPHAPSYLFQDTTHSKRA